MTGTFTRKKLKHSFKNLNNVLKSTQKTHFIVDIQINVQVNKYIDRHFSKIWFITSFVI